MKTLQCKFVQTSTFSAADQSCVIANTHFDPSANEATADKKMHSLFSSSAWAQNGAVKQRQTRTLSSMPLSTDYGVRLILHTGIEFENARKQFTHLSIARDCSQRSLNTHKHTHLS